MVFGNALQRFPNEAHVPLGKVVQTSEIIEHLTGSRVGRQCIDREVAARGILFPVGRERHRRAPAVGGQVAAQRRHLIGMAVAHGSHGAVIYPRRYRLDPRFLETLHNLFWLQACREIDVADREIEKIVADSAADVASEVLRWL